MPYSKVEEAIRRTQRGEPVVVLDDAERENEGDLIVAAETATPEVIRFVLRYTSGVLCGPGRLPVANRRTRGARHGPQR